MTGQAERIKAAHRGYRQAEPASRSRIAALNTFGLRYVHIDDFNVLVEGQFILNIAMSYWRDVDCDDCCGYLVSALRDQIAKRNSEKPVTGRDSDADSGRTACCTTERPLTALAESVTGSPSLLPVVSP